MGVHPLASFYARIQPVYSLPQQKWIFNGTYSSGNVWLPPVKTYFPKYDSAFNRLHLVPWHKRDSVYQLMPQHHDSAFMKADAVIRLFNLSALKKLTKNSALQIQLRAVLITAGKHTLLVNDKFIENFHSNVAGGEDPFSRRKYGFNNAVVQYTDRQGKSILLGKNQLVFQGLNADYVYTPQIKALKKISLQPVVLLHAGFNTSRYYPAVDAGASLGLSRAFKFNEQHAMVVASSFSFLQLNLLNQRSAPQFTTRPYLTQTELLAQYRKMCAKNRVLTFTGIFNRQSALNTPADFDKQVIAGERYTTHWHMTSTHLFRPTESWSVVVSYGGKWKYSYYVRQDFLVDNAPDFQTGAGVILEL